MKKIKYTLFALFVTGIFSVMHSQEGAVEDANVVYKSLTKKFEKSEENIQNRTANGFVLKEKRGYTCRNLQKRPEVSRHNNEKRQGNSVLQKSTG